MTILLLVTSEGVSAEDDKSALFAAATAAYRQCLDGTNSVPTGDTICLSGQTTDEMKARFERNVRPTTKFLVIHSPGGLVSPAMDIALHIMQREIDVVIDGFCISSCANYIFLAARNKFLINKAVVGWHGAPGIPSEEQWSQLSEEKRVRVNQQIEQHKQFFAILRSQGIREELTNDPPPNPSGDSDKAYWRSHFWSYNERILDEKFGVKNVFRVTVESDAVK